MRDQGRAGMESSDRREFIRRAGATCTAMAVSPSLLSQAVQARATAASERIRGLMVDAARVPESLDYYRRVIEFCADWGFNTLQFRLTDDQGSALRFASVPDLVTHPDAFTPDQLKRLVEVARSHGVDVIPEIESFGHTGFITRSARYAHLLDQNPSGSAEFTGIIPVLPETLQLFEKLFGEVAAIFPSTYLHAGCDEVNWGGSAQSRTALKTKTRTQIWAEYLNALNKMSEGLGKQMIVWGDYVLQKEPGILAELDKSIVIMDWNYWDTNALQFHDALEKVRKNGSRGIGAPALISYRWGPRPGRQQLRNIDAFAEVYCESNDPSSLGVVLTNWVPSRYIQNSLWDGFAYAGMAFKEGTAVAQVSGFRVFVERRYGAAWNELWDEAFQLLYDAAPGVYDHAPISAMGLHLPVPWSSDDGLAALVKSGARRANPFTRVRSLLMLLEPSILRNLPDFQAFALCVEYLEGALWREDVVIEHVATNRSDERSSTALIQNIAQRDRELAEKLSKDWDQGRSPDSAAKHQLLSELQPKDQLLYQWQRAAAYSADLALHSDRFHQLLQRSANVPSAR
jgi:hypothetical protein